jgi:PleD family two-component response regulator
MNVLIAEDDALMCLMLQRAVEHLGYACLVAQDEPPDLVLLDLVMPGLDGWEVLCQPTGDALTVRGTWPRDGPLQGHALLVATHARARSAFASGIHAGGPCEVLLWG